MNKFWKTSITRVRPNEILVRGYPIEELVRHCSFGDVTYLLLTGDLPNKKQGQLIEAILVACCDHSLASPSVDAVRFVASSGVPLQAAVAVGVTAIGDWHGGAIEPCAVILKEAVRNRQLPHEIFSDLKNKGLRLPGYGHPLHAKDPRTEILMHLAKKMRLIGPHTRLARELERTSGKFFSQHFPLNVDGAIAALMCDLDIEPALGKAFFIIGRSPGFIAHAFEQMTRERPFKAPSYKEIYYTGPRRRAVGRRSKRKD